MHQVAVDRRVGAARLDRFMKLALVVHDFDPGYGQGRYCVELARRLAGRLPIDVHSNTWNTDSIPGVRWHRVPAWRHNVVTTVTTFLPSVSQSLRRNPATLVHAQGLSCWTADLITAHICNAARQAHLQESPLTARIFTQGITPIERAFYRRQHDAHLIAVSGVVRREIEQHYGWSGRSSVIHHGTDVSRFRPPESASETALLRARFGVPPGAWCWLFVGEGIKGLIPLIHQLVKFPSAQLLAITRSDPGRYRALAEQLGVAQRLILHGPERQLELAYRAADVFVYPAEYDSFALVATEAMASGLPVILGGAIGAAELVEPGKNGLLCDPRDPGSLQHHLHWIQSHPDESRRLGRAARTTLESNTWAECAEATWRVYQAELGRRAASPTGGLL